MYRTDSSWNEQWLPGVEQEKRELVDRGPELLLTLGLCGKLPRSGWSRTGRHKPRLGMVRQGMAALNGPRINDSMGRKRKRRSTFASAVRGWDSCSGARVDWSHG